MPAPFLLIEGSLSGVQTGGSIDLPSEVAHHARRVLRLRPGDAVELSDGRGARVAARLEESGATATGDVIEDSQDRPRLRVLQGFPQARKFDDVVRVLVELGVEEIVAVVAERTQHRPDDAKITKLRNRWKSVARAACEQARRSRLPTLRGPMSLTEALQDADGPLIVAHLGASLDPLGALETVDEPGSITVAVGPEGGWSPREAQQFEDAGALLVSLGRSVLRTEHAAVVLAGIVAAGTGRMAAAADPWD